MSRLFLKKRLKKVLETDNNMIKEFWKVRKEENTTEKK